MPTYSSEELNRLRQEGKSQTDWKRVKNLTDSEIDFSDLPELEEESFKSAKVTKIDRLTRLPIHLPQSQIRNFCRCWQVKELALFGSVLREDFRPDSDIDILISFGLDADWSLLDHVKMQQELGSIFRRKVDLVSKRAIVRSQNWIRRQEILETAKIIYVEQER